MPPDESTTKAFDWRLRFLIQDRALRWVQGRSQRLFNDKRPCSVTSTALRRAGTTSMPSGVVSMSHRLSVTSITTTWLEHYDRKTTALHSRAFTTSSVTTRTTVCNWICVNK